VSGEARIVFQMGRREASLPITDAEYVREVLLRERKDIAQGIHDDLGDAITAGGGAIPVDNARRLILLEVLDAIEAHPPAVPGRPSRLTDDMRVLRDELRTPITP
jgi:hypothetical protein